MPDRQVTHSGKDGNGDITKLCKSGESWTPRMKSEAINDIENKTHSYFVLWHGGHRTEIEVVKDPSGKYLRTDHDNTTKNNLADLPDC